MNTFKQAIEQQHLQLGLWLGLTDPYSAEVCAGAGFDWLLVDAEHAPNDVRSVLAQLQAVAPYASHPIVRPPVGDPVLIKQLLDIGAQTLLVPMVETAEQAAGLVSAMRYPPAGIRGVASSLVRASRFARIPDYLRQAQAQLCLLVQIESKRALANIEAIAAVLGVDGLFIGPSDLSASMGYLGQAAHPDVQAAIKDAIARIRRAGKAAGILTSDESQARRYIELGCTFVAVGSDVGLLARTTHALAERMRSLAPSENPNS